MPNSPLIWKSEELTPIRDKVYGYIKQAIVQGVYRSGDRIVERDLADQLGVSRTPIREALFRLETQGFVKTLPRRGVVVSQLTPDEVVEIFTILAALEPLAMKQAAEKTDASHRAELEQVIVEIDAALREQSNQNDQWTYHFKLNDVVCRAAGSPRLTEMLGGLSDYIRAFANAGYEIPGRFRQATEEHLELARAVMAGDAEKAERLTRIHLDNARKAYMKALDSM